MGINDIKNAAKERIGPVSGPLLYNIVIIFAICLFLSAASFYWLFPVLHSIDRNISNEQSAEASNANMLLSLFLNETFSHLTHFGEHAFDDGISSENIHVLSESRPDFLNLSVFDTKGNLIFSSSRNESSPPPFKPGNSASELAFFRESVKGDIYVGPVLLGGSGPSIQVALPLRRDGKVAAVATSEIDFTLLWETTKNIQVKDGKTYIVDKAGTLIADQDINRARSGENLKYRNVVHQLSLGRDSVVRDSYVNENGEKVIAFGLKMKNTDWGIVVEKIEDRAMKQRNDTLILAIVFTAASILMIILLILSTLRLARALLNIEREKAERERTIAYLPDGVVEFTGENQILNINAAAKKFLDISKPMPNDLYVIETGALPEGFEKLKKIFFQQNRTEGGQGNISEIIFEEPERRVLQIITIYIKGSGPPKDQRYLKIIHNVTHDGQI